MMLLLVGDSTMRIWTDKYVSGLFEAPMTMMVYGDD